MMNSADFLARSWRENGGASIREYALWLATLAVGLAVGAFILS
jgi:Flp pilus assembly pilin Flp